MTQLFAKNFHNNLQFVPTSSCAHQKQAHLCFWQQKSLFPSIHWDLTSEKFPVFFKFFVATTFQTRGLLLPKPTNKGLLFLDFQQ